MGLICVYVCDRCGHQVVTSGPQEFTWGADGEVVGLGHPVFAQAHEIAGVFMHGYCTACGTTQEVVLSKLARPTRDPVAAATELAAMEPGPVAQMAPVACPACGFKAVVLVLPADRRTACPRCPDGRLVPGPGGGIT